MQTEPDPTKIYDITNKVIDRIMQATGIIAIVWLLAFLLAAMIEK